jgi:uncharacterized protein
MKSIEIKVIPNAKQDRVSDKEKKLKVYVTVPAIDGRANKVAVKVLADFLKVKKRRIKITKGKRSREKVVTIF